MGRKKLKVVMLGEGRVGKTSLLHRFINNTFDEECKSTQKATMYANTKVEVGETTADVSIWDTAGQERYHALGPIYYRDAHGAVLAYDITDKDSFDKVKVWLKELHQVVGENIQVVVVGNKIDLERERKVPKKDADEWAQQHNAQHFQCSAKLGLKVSEAFTSLVKTIVEKLPPEGTSKTKERGGGTGTGAQAGGSTGPPPPRSKGVKIAPIEEPSGQQKQNNGDKCKC